MVDTETTGLAPWGTVDGVPTQDPHGPDRLCSAALVRLRRRKGAWRLDGELVIRCDPGRPVGLQAARVNGFHWSGDGSPVPAGSQDLAGELAFSTVAGQVVRFMGDAAPVCHNTTFDAAMLNGELHRAGLPMLTVPTYCTKKAFSDLRGLGRPDEYVPGTNLNALCRLLGINPGDRQGTDGVGEVHGALADARLAAEAFLHLDVAGWMLAEAASTLPHRRVLVGQD